jgi:phosphoglycerate kinase
MGGSKVSDKIGMIEHLLSKIDSVFIGGAMSYAFLKAMEIEVGKSLCEDKQVRVAERLLKAAEVRNIKIHLPVDHAVVTDIKDPSTLSVTPGVEIPPQKMGIDIGPRTLVSYETELQNAATIFWNGPMGVFEVPEYAKGTFGLARAIAKTKALKLVGGGDSASAVQLSGCEDQFDFISTGGGATLEYLEGKELPGLKALENQIRKTEVFPEEEGGTHEP